MGWMFTDTVAAVACPRCGQPAGSHCRQPKGRPAQYPHIERSLAFKATPDFNIDNYRIKVHRLIS